ncbi:MAG TPA: hypothetical protein DCZ40_06350, partial [Lachnospiraceae bacterium]|nr:hypothetical protein [Lachnospiraceae bacterium]
MKIKDCEKLLNLLPMTGVYVIREDTHQILYFNERIKEAVPDIEIGAVRHELWVNPDSGVLYPGERGQNAGKETDCGRPFDATDKITAVRMMWEESISASAVTVAFQEKKIERGIENLFFAVYEIDLENDTFLAVTQKKEAEKLFGETASYTEAIRMHAEHFVHPDFREGYLGKMDRRNLLEKLENGHSLVAAEYPGIKKGSGEMPENGSWIRVMVTVSESKDGKPAKALYVAQDVTEIKKKEEMEHTMLKEACDAANRANAFKSEFLSRMSHDIRTP